MHSSFKDLAVKDDTELRDTERLKRLYNKNFSGLKIASVCCIAMGIPLAALTVWLAWDHFIAKAATIQPFWTLFGVVAGFGTICLGMGLAFWKECSGNPLAGYLKDPAGYVFTLGSITEATYLPADEGRGKMMVSGTFGEKGIFIEEFSPGPWSNAVAERGEDEGLKPGDDRYDQKGKRVRLPITAWIIYHSSQPHYGALAGIPAEIAARLNKK